MPLQKSTRIEIRRADPADAPAIARVLLESFLEFKALYTEAGFAATTPEVDQILRRMQEGPVWVALCDEDVIGTVAAVIRGDAVYIRGMAVLPAARGSGAGAKLLKRVEDWALREGFLRLFLSTTPFLDSAIHLYEKAGFQRISGKHDLFGTPLFTMEKTLSPS